MTKQLSQILENEQVLVERITEICKEGQATTDKIRILDQLQNFMDSNLKILKEVK